MLVVSRKGLTDAEVEALSARLREVGETALDQTVGGHRVFRVACAPERTAAVLALPGVEGVHPDGSIEPEVVSRRTFLDYVILGGVGVWTLGAAGAALGYLRPPRIPFTTRGLTYVCPAGELGEGEAREFFIQDQPALLVRRQGRMHALKTVCTHRNTCVVGWDAERRELVCPCHNAGFDVHGNVLHGPPQRPLPVLEVHEVSGKVYVRNGG